MTFREKGKPGWREGSATKGWAYNHKYKKEEGQQSYHLAWDAFTYTAKKKKVLLLLVDE